MSRIKTYDELTIRDDFMFCKVLEHDEDLCRELVERILDVKIEKIHRLGQQKVIRVMPDKRGIRLDVSFVGDDRIYNVEMQNGHREVLPRRSRYYQGLSDLDAMEQGYSYDMLPDTCIIFICTFDPFDRKLPCYTIRPKVEEDPGIPYNDGTTKVFVSTAGIDREGIRPELQALFAYIEGEPASDDFTRRLDAAVEKARSMENWRREYMLLEEKYADYLAEGRAEGRAEGHREGLAEGRMEAVREIATRMLQEGEPADRIVHLTGLTEEDINSLQPDISSKE